MQHGNAEGILNAIKRALASLTSGEIFCKKLVALGSDGSSIIVTQCSWHSLCPRYTREIPATYAGSEGLPCGKCAWLMQGVNKSLRVEPLLTFKCLFQQYVITGTAYKNTLDILTSNSGITTPLKRNKINEIIIRNDNISVYNNMLSSMCNIIIIIIK